MRAVRVAVRRAANEPSSRRDELTKKNLETSEKAIRKRDPEIKPEPEVKPEPEGTQEPFTIRDTFGIGE